MVLAHIAGLPVEETALSFGPVLLAAGGLVGLQIRERIHDDGRKITLRRHRRSHGEERG
jgi:hypothetical protein